MALLALPACIALAAAACPLPPAALQQGALQQAAVQVVWAPDPKPIVVGRHFALELQICPAAAELTRIDASMPEHRHGMNYRPSLKRLSGASAEHPARWRAEGLLFHMPGRWELRVEVQTADGSVTLLTSITVP